MPLLPSVASSSMHGAVVPIAYAPLSSSGLFVFTNIPQNYQDLRIVAFLRSNASSTTDQAAFWFGNYGANIYGETYLLGDGSSASSSRGSTQAVFTNSAIIPAATSTSGVYGSVTIDILNYANTSTYKTVITRTAADTNGSGSTRLAVGSYQSTSAISSKITIVANTATSQFFASGSSVAIYGIRTVNQ